MTDASAQDERLTELAHAAARGDEHATAQLFEILLPRVRNLVRYLVRGDRDVDDLSQEALLAVHRGLPSYQGTGQFRSWADRVTARCVFAQLKRKSPLQMVENGEERLGDSAADTEVFAVRRQLVKQLDLLPQEQRLALVLHYVLGMTVPEIAEETDVSDETVRSRMRLGKKHLRSQLETPRQKVAG